MTHIPDEAVQDFIEYAFKEFGMVIQDLSAQRLIKVALPHLSTPCAVEVDKEQIAKIIYSAMSSAVAGDPCKYKAPEWVDGGNSYMQGTARYFADHILSCVVTKPVDVAAVRKQAFEEAAKIIETYQEGSTSRGGKRVIIERPEGDRAGLGYADAIRALSAEPA